MPATNLEDKFKLTLLQIEKRFVDLEMGLGELKDKMKDVSPEQLASINQRMEDIEDLTMVENAAVIELKKMLEDISQKFNSLTTSVSEINKLGQRLDSLEKEIHEVSSKPADLEIQEKIKSLESEFSELISKKPQSFPEIEELHKKTSEISQRLTNLKMEYEDVVKNIEARLKSVMSSVSGVPIADLDFIDSRLQSLKTAIDMLSDKKVETDLKIAGLEEKIVLLNEKIKEALSQKFVDEIKSNKRDIMASTVRIESAERVIKEINVEIQELQKRVGRFEGFEKLTLLNKEVEEKLERFKFIEDQTSRLSTRVEAIYDDMNKNFAGFKNMEKRIEGIIQNMNNIDKDLEKLKIDMKLSGNAAALNEIVRTLNDLQDKVSRLNKEVPAIFVEKSEIKNVVYGMRDRVNSLDNRMREINQIMGNVKPEDVQKVMQTFSKIEDLVKRVEIIERKVEEVKETTPDITEAIPPASYLDEEISELLGKLVYLESRIAAIEKTVSERPSMQPIILE